MWFEDKIESFTRLTQAYATLWGHHILPKRVRVQTFFQNPAWVNKFRGSQKRKWIWHTDHAFNSRKIWMKGRHCYSESQTFLLHSLFIQHCEDAEPDNPWGETHRAEEACIREYTSLSKLCFHFMRIGGDERQCVGVCIQHVWVYGTRSRRVRRRGGGEKGKKKKGLLRQTEKKKQKKKEHVPLPLTHAHTRLHRATPPAAILYLHFDSPTMSLVCMCVYVEWRMGEKEE